MVFASIYIALIRKNQIAGFKSMIQYNPISHFQSAISAVDGWVFPRYRKHIAN